MDYIDQAKMIWGTGYDWFRKPIKNVETKTFEQIGKQIGRNLYYDCTIYHTFLSFVLEPLNNWATFRVCILETGIIPEEWSRYDYAFRNDGSILVKQGDTKDWFIVIKQEEAAPEAMRKLGYEKMGSKILLKLDEWEDQPTAKLYEEMAMLSCNRFLDGEIYNSGRWYKNLQLAHLLDDIQDEYEWESEDKYIPNENGIFSLYLFDACDFNATILIWLFQDADLVYPSRELWVVPFGTGEAEFGEDDPGPLVVDPRIAYALRNSSAIVDSIDRVNLDVESVLCGYDYFNHQLQSNTHNIPLAIDNPTDDDKIDFMKRMWTGIRDEILSVWLNHSEPPKLKFPLVYYKAREEIIKSKDFLRTGKYRDAIKTAGDACSWLCEHEFGNGKWHDILLVHKTKIIEQHGWHFYQNLIMLKEIRNKATHNSRYEPDMVDADEVVKLAEIVLNRLQKIY